MDDKSIDNGLEFNGAITFMVFDDGATIEIRDRTSSTTFVKVKLTQHQLCQALSRLGNTPCTIETRGLDHVGKKMAMDELRFEIPKHDYSNRDIVAKQEARRLCPEGYFGSKVYFATVDGKVYANTTIRKWD